MSKNIVEELPARKHTPVAAPVAKKEGTKPSGDKKVVQKGGTSEEASAKRIRQAVYDIRYRARRDDIELSIAFQQYMSNSNLSAKEVAAVREKLGLSKSSSVKEQFTKGANNWASDGVANALYKVFVEQEDPEFELAYVRQLEESEERKYKVRVTDKNGKSYIRFADRAKITELRSNSNIKSVEMTEHGDVVGSERQKGKQTAKTKAGKLDPVGKEDADVDNDGDVDKSDKYLLKRRKAIGQSIRMRAEEKLKEGTTSVEPPIGSVKITGKGVDNYSSGAVKVNPNDKQEDPSVVKSKGVYAHLELLGTNLSESQKKLFEMIKKKEDEKKKEVSSVMTKDKMDDPCEPKEGEEKKDMRGTYAKLNIIRNKFRAAGQRTPFVTLDDIGEEKNTIQRSGTSTNAAGEKIHWKSSYNKETGSNTVTDKFGTTRTNKDGGMMRMPELKGRTKPVKTGPKTGRPAPKVETGPADKKPAPSKGPKTKKPYPGYNPQKGVGPEYKP